MLKTALVRAAALASLGAAIAAGRGTAAPFDGKLTVNVRDESTGEPLAVRLDLRDARGRSVRVRPEKAVVAGDSIYFDGSATLELRRGAYAFLLEAGPEFITRTARFTIDRRAEDSTDVTLTRRVDMHDEGWWSGDIDVQLPLADMPLVMRARGVDFAPVTAWVNDHGRCVKSRLAPSETASAVGPPLYGPWAALDDRRGGPLLLIGADSSIDVCRWKANDSSLPVARAGRDAGACVVAASPAAWDLPLWIAAGQLDAISIIPRQGQVGEGEGQRPPPDRGLFPDKDGAGRYAESIYHHLLNCGQRLPPAAGAGAGARAGRREIPTPLGAGRVCVHCGESCTTATWLDGLRAGRVVATNGPLLRTRVEGHPPGHVFQLAAGEQRSFQIALDLAFYEEAQVEYLEIIKNGRVIHHVRLDQLAHQAGRLPTVEFDAAGWFLVRAVTNNSEFYQFASTGPYYVEVDGRPRISRASARYFLDWLDDSARKFADNAAVAAECEAARPFWQALTDRATAD
jgi:hypothetical protein